MDKESEINQSKDARELLQSKTEDDNQESIPIYPFSIIARAFAKINGDIEMDFNENLDDYQLIVDAWNNYWQAKDIDPELALQAAEELYDPYGSDDMIPPTQEDHQDFYDQIEQKIAESK